MISQRYDRLRNNRLDGRGNLYLFYATFNALCCSSYSKWDGTKFYAYIIWDVIFMIFDKIGVSYRVLSFIHNFLAT